MKKLILFIFLKITLISEAQRNCGTDLYNHDILKQYPELTGRYGVSNTDNLLNEKLNRLTGIINIPIAIHVLYSNDEENISDNNIRDQITQLNLDFAAKNVDVKNVPIEFRKLIANSGFHFEVKKISRKRIIGSPFFISLIYDGAGQKVYSKKYEPIKFSELGGDDALPYTEYLNIWVGNITDGSTSQLLGYASFPGGLANYDGVVIYYKAFGLKNAEWPFDRGRTATHEIAHWLNLQHIGGNRIGGCGNDLVSDTPPQKGGTSADRTGNDAGQNFGDPIHPLKHIGECGNTVAEMYMNFMDYVNDSSMYMFTIKQKDRMRSLFVEGGKRASFINKDIQQVSFTEASGRQNIYSPIILSVYKNYFSKFAKISWKPDKTVLSYKVSIKKVRANGWIDTITMKNFINIQGLEPKVIYEVKVQANLRNENISRTSSSFLFFIKHNGIVKSNALQFVQ